jgi:D-inositol-3-phosphate glycosyltransferase
VTKKLPAWRICRQSDLEANYVKPITRRLGEKFHWHRKLWEFVEIAKAFDEHCKPGSKVLGFAVGREPLASAFARDGAYVTATDQPPENAEGWDSTGQYASDLRALNDRRLCRPKLFSRRATFRHVDMREIPEDLRDGSYDFVWSACAFEHLGSIQAGLEFVLSAMECLKPGGIAVHTTEFNLSSNDETLGSGPTVLFRTADLQILADELRARGHEVGELDLKPGTQPRDLDVDENPGPGRDHLVLRVGPFVSTSAILTIRKGRKKVAPRKYGPRRMSPRLLLIGDVAPTGFGRVASSILRPLSNVWDIAVLGLSYNGDPHPYPWRIYPAGADGDPYGANRLAPIVRRENPDVIIINSDPWVVGGYLDAASMIAVPPPIVAYMPVDSPCQIKKDLAFKLNRLSMAIWYTQFGSNEAKRAGYKGSEAIIPHGIDLAKFHPMDRREARKAIGLNVPTGAFVFGNVNRNQPRKRFDLTIDYFGAWLKENQKAPAYLYLHCAPHEGIGWDIPHLVDSAGLKGRVFCPNMNMAGHRVMPEELMSAVFSACDVGITTTEGEGWGLCQAEGMACGVPQIVPHYSALGEWAKGAVEYVPVTSIHAHSNYPSGGIGGVASKRGFIEAMTRLYEDAERREELSKLGRSLVSRPEFKWSNIAAQFDAAFRYVIKERKGGRIRTLSTTPLRAAAV